MQGAIVRLQRLEEAERLRREEGDARLQKQGRSPEEAARLRCLG